MWTLRYSGDYEKRLKHFQKVNRTEVKNCLANLTHYHDELQFGHKPQQIIRGFLHSEKMGLWAIDETGPSKSKKKALRLYVYPDEATRTLYVLILGDKSTQSDDINRCCEAVTEIIQANREL